MINLHPKDKFQEARLLYYQGKTDEGIIILKNIKADSSNSCIILEADLLELIFKFRLTPIAEIKEKFLLYLNEAKDINDNRCISLASLGLAVANEYLSFYEEALTICDDILKKNVTFYDIDLKILLKEASSRILWRMGKYRESINLNEEVINLRLDNGFENELSINYNILAINFLVLGDLTQALNYTFKALVHGTQYNILVQTSIATNNIALIFQRMGELQKALSFYEASLIIKRSLKDKIGYATTLSNIAEIRSMEGNLRETIYLLEQTRRIREELTDNLGLVATLTTLSFFYFEQGENQRALKMLDGAIDLAIELGDDLLLAKALAKRSKLYISLDYLIDAEKDSKRAIALFNKQTSDLWIVEPLLDYATVKYYLGYYDQARNLLNEAIMLSKKHSSKRETLLCKYLEAVFLKEEENIGESNKILTEINIEAKKMKLTNLTSDSQLLLSELALIFYRIDPNDTTYEQVKDEVNAIIDLARVEGKIQLLIDGLTIFALINSAKGSFNEALESIDNALSITKKHNLILKEIRGMEIKQKIMERSSINQEIYAEYRDIFERYDTIDAIKLLQQSKSRKLILDPSDIHLVAFKYTLSEIEVIAENVPREFGNSKSLAVDLGAFYMLAIGQGDNYHDGLFGPLPVAMKEDYSSLVYASTISDENQNDKRLAKSTYVIICLLYPNDKSNFFTDRGLLHSIFQQEITLKIEDVSEINRFVLRRLREKFYALCRPKEFEE